MKKNKKTKDSKKEKKKTFTIILFVILTLVLLAVLLFTIVNVYVKSKAASKILTVPEATEQENVSCILVLGCGVRDDGTPSPMLVDRVERAVELYRAGAAPKLLMTGDHGRVDYNEVGTMKQMAMDRGVPSEDIFMDHAGFSTYESMYRAKEIFQVEKVIIVTQEYHLYRAVYIAENMGMEAYGVDAGGSYRGQTMRDIRESVARVKDFMTAIFKPKPTYLGESISINGNGDVTND